MKTTEKTMKNVPTTESTAPQDDTRGLHLRSNWTPRNIGTGAIILCAIVAPLVLTGCSAGGGEKAAVCDTTNGTDDYLVVAMSSVSDLGTAQQFAQPVLDDVIPRVAKSCGTLTVAVAGNRSEDLELRQITLKPDKPTAYNEKTKRLELQEKAEAFAKKNFLTPLSKTKATAGSPFLGTIQKISAEAASHPEYRKTMVLIGDSIDIEDSAVPGNARVDFRKNVPQSALDDFELKGGPSCVILMGAGRRSDLPAYRVRAARKMLKTTLERSGIAFAATSSTSVPVGCPKGGAR